MLQPVEHRLFQMLKPATDSMDQLDHQLAIGFEMEVQIDCWLLVPVALSAKAAAA